MPHGSHGFSLVELLVTIAVIGIICSIAVPALSVSETGKVTRDRRNAQELASLCASAQAAGLDLVVPGDLDQTVANLIRGGSPSSGPFKDRLFALRGMAAQDAINAAKYLRLEGRYLIFMTDAISVAGRFSESTLAWFDYIQDKHFHSRLG